MAIINGTSASETLLGTSGADTIKGLGGNDTITGGTGNDLAQMGAGNDVFIWNSGDGDDKVEGQDGFDTLLVNGSSTGLESFLIGATGNGTRAGVLRFFEGIVADMAGVERIWLRALGDSDGITVQDLTGTDVQQVVVDLAGTVGGTVGDGAIDAVFREGTFGNDTINVTVVNNRVQVNGLSAQLIISHADANDGLEVDGLAGNDTINASTLLPNVMQLSIDGGTGNDIITGSAGNDELDGGDGNDVIRGGRGNDIVDLGTGNDVFGWSQGDGKDTVNGGSGIDTLLITGSIGGEVFDIQAFGGSVSAAGIGIDDMERIKVRALAGNDTIILGTLAGTDVSTVDIDLSAAVLGTLPDAATDTIIIDSYTAGDDVVEMAWSGSKIVLTGLTANLSIAHSGANDLLLFSGNLGNDLYDASSLPAGKISLRFEIDGVDTIIGSAGKDTVLCFLGGEALAYLGAGNDSFQGSDGNDVAHMGAGNDAMQGGKGNDVGFLGAGNDTVIWRAGDGDDTLRGQEGFDSLVFEDSGITDLITIAPNVSRVGVSEFLGNVLDLDDIERIIVRPLAGADGVFIDNLAGTDVTQIVVDLAGVPGGASSDGEVDGVVRNGGGGNDIINVAQVSGAVSITGLSAAVTIRNADSDDILEINGLGGNDTINASTLLANVMQLTIDGEAGNDRITGSLGNDELDGGDGNDVVTGWRGDDIVDLGAGDDLFIWSQGDGKDTVNGGDGFDTLFLSETLGDSFLLIHGFGASLRAATSVNGLSKGEIIADDLERIKVRALAGSDIITVGDLFGLNVSAVDIDLAAAPSGALPDADFDSVSVLGTKLNDVMEVTWTSDKIVTSIRSTQVSIAHADVKDELLIRGGGGNDVVDARGLPADKMSLTFVTLGNDTIFGSAGNDRVLANEAGNAGNEIAYLGAGNDFFQGGDGNDSARMGAGNDLLQGGAGNDIGFLGAGNDTMNGGAGNDLAYLDEGNDLYIWSVGGGVDTVDAGAGIDTLQFNGSAAGEDTTIDAVGAQAQVTRNVADGTVDLDAFEQIRIRALGGIDNIFVNDLAGTGIKLVAVDLAGAVASAADGANDSVSVRGNAGNNSITVTASSGVVSVSGLATQVTVTHFDASDGLLINGLDGNDTISAALFPANALQLFLYGGIGSDTITGSAGRDIVDGGPGANLLRGGGGSDQLMGGQDNDRLDGGAGADNLIGLGGHDVILGGLGDDGIQGGQGNDTITGGAGNDRISYTSVLDGHDVILDFDGNPTGGQDTLHLEFLFQGLGVPVQDRVGRVFISDKGATVDVAVDADGNAGNGYELVVATLHTVDEIKLGQDVITS